MPASSPCAAGRANDRHRTAARSSRGPPPRRARPLCAADRRAARSGAGRARRAPLAGPMTDIGLPLARPAAHDLAGLGRYALRTIAPPAVVAVLLFGSWGV